MSNQGGDLIEIEKMDIFKDNEVHAFGNSSVLATSIASLAETNGLPMNENQKVGEELRNLLLPTKFLTHININGLCNDRCRNPSLGLATKARAYKGAHQK